MPKFLGRLMGLWVATEAPTDPTKTDGYTFVAMATNHDLSIAIDTIEGGNKDDGAWNDSIDGNRGYTLPVEGEADRTVSEGIDILEDAALNEGTDLWWLLTTGEEGDYQRHGKASIGAFNLSHPNREFSTYSAELRGQGKYTRTVVS